MSLPARVPGAMEEARRRREERKKRNEIPRVPWSDLGPEFAATWGRADPSNPQPEHMEIVGMTGSGKTYFLCVVMQERMIVRDTPEIIIATKPADGTLGDLGWPVVTNWREAQKHRQVIFWPQTKEIGKARRAYQHEQIYQLLARLWQPNANTVVAFDEIAYVESLSADMRDMVEMYWREGRSQGITVVGMKQRPQGANRHMSSESYWTVAYPPKDRADMERFAELFGNKRRWIPVLESMSFEDHEFLIRNHRTDMAYISWIDFELEPIPPEDEDRMGGYLGRKKTRNEGD